MSLPSGCFACLNRLCCKDHGAVTYSPAKYICWAKMGCSVGTKATTCLWHDTEQCLISPRHAACIEVHRPNVCSMIAWHMAARTSLLLIDGARNMQSAHDTPTMHLTSSKVVPVVFCSLVMLEVLGHTMTSGHLI